MENETETEVTCLQGLGCPQVGSQFGGLQNSDCVYIGFTNLSSFADYKGILGLRPSTVPKKGESM